MYCEYCTVFIYVSKKQTPQCTAHGNQLTWTADDGRRHTLNLSHYMNSYSSVLDLG
jgi:hypothetical protein